MNFTDPTYFSVIALKPVLKAEKNRFVIPFLCSSDELCGFKNSAAKAGLKVKAFTAEIRIAIARVIPNCW